MPSMNKELQQMTCLAFANLPEDSVVTVTALFVSKRVGRDEGQSVTVLQIEDEEGTIAPVIIPPGVELSLFGLRVGRLIQLTELVVCHPGSEASGENNVCPLCGQATEEMAHMGKHVNEVKGITHSEISDQQFCFVGTPDTKCYTPRDECQFRATIEREFSQECPVCVKDKY